MLICLMPVFNEEKNVIDVLNKLEKQVDYLVIVNDGSFDQTNLFLSNWIKNKESVCFLSYPKNKGMSYALLQGFRFISEQYKKGKFLDTDVIITIDADGQHNPDEVIDMYKYFHKNNLDVLIGKRNLSNYPSYRIIGNKFTSSVASCLGGFKFEDVECGFRMLKTNFITELLKYYRGFRYSCAGEIGIIAILLGYKVNNKYPIQVSYYRKRGPRFMDLFINLVLCLSVFLRIKFSFK